MEKVKGLTLFHKMLLFIIVLFVAIATINSIFFSISLYNNLTSEFISKATAVAQGLADSSVDIFANGDAASVQSHIDKFAGLSGVGYVFIVGNDRQILSHTFIGHIPEEIIELVSKQTGELTDEISKQDIVTGGSGRYIDISAPILLGKMGFLHVGMDKKIIQQTILKAILFQNGITVLLFILSIAAAYIVIQRIERPLTALTRYSNALSTHDFRSRLTDNFGINEVALKSTDEVGLLAHSFSRLESIIMEYIANLERETAEKERIRSELEVARTIQAGFLRRFFPAYPDRKEIDIYATVDMAKEVGGDLYDFFFIDREHLCLVIGDVSGKGVPAALFMALTKSLLRSVAKEGVAPAEILKRVNGLLYPENDACMFVTLLCGILDVRTGEFELANGGHNPPLMTGDDGRLNFIKLPPGTLIGAIEEPVVGSITLTLKPDDVFFMYTDGVTESLNPSDEFFGEERLYQCANLTKTHDARQLVMNVRQEINSFAKDAAQADDITMLAIRYLGAGG
jgi:sigma-B regulation protein RsbU (phosphoserine phosphatase)